MTIKIYYIEIQLCEQRIFTLDSTTLQYRTFFVKFGLVN